MISNIFPGNTVFAIKTEKMRITEINAEFNNSIVLSQQLRNMLRGMKLRQESDIVSRRVLSVYGGWLPCLSVINRCENKRIRPNIESSKGRKKGGFKSVIFTSNWVYGVFSLRIEIIE